MKTKIFAAIFIFSMLAFQGCKDDDNIKVPSQYEDILHEKYPAATNIRWEREDGYYVANFIMNANSSEAWFDHNYKWYYTETDIAFGQLPESVQKAFNESAYSSWHIDDIDMVERYNLETIYVIEVENGDAEVDLYYIADGSLIKTSTEQNNSYFPSEVSAGIKAFIAERYPQARIIEIEYEHNAVEVEIVDGAVKRELLFSNAEEWIYTKTEIRKSEVPAEILSVLNASDYASWYIDDIDFYETPDGDYYLFDLESGNREAKIAIYTDGTLVKKSEDNNNNYSPGEGTATQGIEAFIAERYPQAYIVDIDYEHNTIEVEIRDGNIERELLFTGAEEWIYTKTEIRKSQVPYDILSVLNASNYASWKIDDIDFYETPNGDYYLFELESGNREVEIAIYTDGTMKVIKNS